MSRTARARRPQTGLIPNRGGTVWTQNLSRGDEAIRARGSLILPVCPIGKASPAASFWRIIAAGRAPAASIPFKFVTRRGSTLVLIAQSGTSCWESRGIPSECLYPESGSGRHIMTRSYAFTASGIRMQEKHRKLTEQTCRGIHPGGPPTTMIMWKRSYSARREGRAETRSAASSITQRFSLARHLQIPLVGEPEFKAMW